MKDSITTLITGSAGVTAVEAIPYIAQEDVTHFGGVVQVIVQIVIGVATLLGLFKNKKKV